MPSVVTFRFLCLLWLCLILSGCRAPEEIDPSVNEREPLTVQAVSVEETASGTQVLEFSGKVRAAKSTKLGFLRGGRILSLNKDEGESMTSGELIGTLDTRAIAARSQELRAQLREAQASSTEIEAPPRRFEKAGAEDRVREIDANLELVNQKLARREALYLKGAIAKESLDELISQKKALENQRTAAVNRVKDLSQGARPETRRVGRARVDQVRANIQSLEVDLADSELRAPYSATVSRRLVDEGTIVSAGQAVYELVTEGRLEAEFFLPPAKVEQLRPNQPLEVTIEGETYTAQVQELLPMVDQSTGTRPVLVSLPRTATVQAGQLARLKFESEMSESGYWLPSTALLPGERGLFTCYTAVPSENGLYEVKKQALEQVRTTGERVFVRGTLSGEQKVITEGIQRVVPGQKVRLR